jgi:hypothetical protein
MFTGELTVLIEVSKSKVIKLLMEHIQEELTTEEFYELLVKLLKLYKKFDGAAMEDFQFLFSKRSTGD